VARLQGILGPEGVAVPQHRGGRTPGEEVVPVPAHAVRLGTAQRIPEADRPWPGRLPAPAPAVVHPDPVPAEVLDAAGAPVGVTGRGLLTADPAGVVVGGRAPLSVTAWCGPWPYDELWWDPRARRRRARLQVVTMTGEALLLVRESGRWHVEASYD
jgi:protein ImuB